MNERFDFSQDPGPEIIHKAGFYGVTIDKWIRHVLSIHFDPESGSQYWLQREKVLGIDARKDITSLKELHKLGPME